MRKLRHIEPLGGKTSSLTITPQFPRRVGFLRLAGPLFVHRPAPNMPVRKGNTVLAEAPYHVHFIVGP